MKRQKSQFKSADSEIHRNDYAYGGFFLSGSGGAYQRRTVFDDFLCGSGVLLRDAVSEGEGRCRGGGMKKDREGRS